MINVTKPYLPPLEEYQKYLEGIWERCWLTNYGPLVKELEEKLKEELKVKNIQFLVNGTVPLQIAIKVFDLKGEIITTPFSYVATTGAILWENCAPVFADIEPSTFCIDPEKIEALITKNTSAIMATHVFGFPCDVVKIKKIADKHNLKVIYDGAHAFGVKVFDKSIFEYGDISTCSFHATKLFHTVEGGAIFCNDNDLNEKIRRMKSFGHLADTYYSIGINGKNSEFHAAMGLCVLPHVKEFIEKRKQLITLYNSLLLSAPVQIPKIPQNVEYNYSYMPIVFGSEMKLLEITKALEANNIFARRYFYPSLNKLPYLVGESCPVSERIASSILCLPLYHELEEKDVRQIASIILKKL